MAGRTNIRKHGRIKKCRSEDKKDGRKHPVEDQNWCLWDSTGKKILYAAPTRQEAEKQERAVQYYKHKGSVTYQRQIFCRALIQAEVPGTPPPLDWKMKVALTSEELEMKLRPWLSNFIKFAHALEDVQERLLERLPRKAELLKKIRGNYTNLVKNLDLGKMGSVADAFGDVGMELVDVSTDLKEVFNQRTTYANYLRQINPAMERLEQDDPTKILFLEAVASLHAVEVMV